MVPLKQRVRARYDALAPVYERRWARYLQRSIGATLDRLPLGPGERLLDVGCGTGLLLVRLLERQPTAQLAGIDLSPAMVGRARARLPGSVSLLVGDAEALPFRPETFDVVVSASSFHYWPDPERGLECIRRVLRPGGRLVITDWCDDYLACRIVDRILRWIGSAHRKIYGLRECGAFLARAGYDLTGLERYRISLLWGLMTASARVPAA